MRIKDEYGDEKRLKKAKNAKYVTFFEKRYIISYKIKIISNNRTDV